MQNKEIRTIVMPDSRFSMKGFSKVYNSLSDAKKEAFRRIIKRDFRYMSRSERCLSVVEALELVVYVDENNLQAETSIFDQTPVETFNKSSIHQYV